jgi:hypothetical protein
LRPKYGWGYPSRRGQIRHVGTSWQHTKSSVPHPFAFFLAKGWETTNINRVNCELRADG